MKTIRIFISSPGDVVEERDRARQVVEQLRHRYAGQFDLKAVLWEDLPLQADMSFQQGIDVVLSKERGIDIAVFILWSRLGSPLGAVIRKPDGSSYRSGTEREFDLVLAARRQSGIDAPKVLIYTRQDEASFDERLRGRPTEEKTKLVEQKRLVESFIHEEFHDADTGINIRAYHNFDYPVTFSQRLRVHLQEILDPLAGDSTGDPVWDVTNKGSPFRGLEVFEFEHNPVFFGREDEVLEVRRALQRKAQEGCAFVLISGASGSGKSSLARAGVLPAIVEYEVDSAVAGWRHAVCTPSQLGENLCKGLARLLSSELVLPELRIAADSAAILGEGFLNAPKATVDQSVRPALVCAAAGNPGTIRLCLLVDQMEELFTDKRFTNDDREQFVAALESLARSGVVWVLATVRSDFYQYCQVLPVLVRMKEGPGQIDLLLPTPDALRRLIVHPARLAGLVFEQREGASLADRILNDAAAHPELLPLLSFLLRELFEQRTVGGVLTFVAYEQLGGVEGALAKRAETVFAALPNAAQHELNHVLRALVSVSGDEEESVVRQRVALETFSLDTPARALVDRFVEERFLVAEADSSGQGTVAVAHEALLRVWSRAAQWVAGNRDFLRVRARVAARMKEGSRLLEGDPLLDLARLHLATAAGGFTPGQGAFIEDSVRAVEQAGRRRERTRNGVVTVLAVLTIISVLAGLWATAQKREAVKQSRESIKQSQLADAKKAEALQTLSQSDFLQGVQFMKANRSDAALAFLVRSLSANFQNEAAATCLAIFLEDDSWELPVFTLKHNGPINSVQYSPDGKWIVTASKDKTAQVWDAHSGQPIGQLMKHFGEILFAQFSPDSSMILTISTDTNARLWDALTGQPLCPPLKHGEALEAAQFSPDGGRIVTASDDKTARVWDVHTGHPLTQPMKHEGLVKSAQFSPDGKRIVTASWDNTARIWDAQTGQPLTQPMKHGNFVNYAQFSPDGKRIVTASWDNTARIWDAQTGQPLTQPMKHGSFVNYAQFSPDGQRIVTVSTDDSAQIWEAQTGFPLSQPMKHSGLINTVQFSPDGKWVITASCDETARIWDAQTGQPLTQPMKHEGVVYFAQFSPDGRRIVTASSDGIAQAWDIQIGKNLPERMKHDDAVSSAQFSPDGTQIITGSKDKTARVWDVQTGQPLTPPLRHDGEVCYAQFSPDGKRIVTASKDKTAQLWNAQTGQPLYSPMKHDGEVCFAQFSPDGKVIVTGSWDKTARVWDAQTSLPLTPPMKHNGQVWSVQFSPDGKRIVTASVDGTARVWDAQTGQPKTPPMKHSSGVTSAQFSPDSQKVVTASSDWTARVWDAQTGQPKTPPMKHDAWVTSAQFSPDGRRIVTASWDKTARVWDVETGQPLTVPMKHDDWVVSAKFSPNGKWIITASQNGTALVWDAQTGQPLSLPFKHDGPLQAAEFSPDGRKVVTAAWDGTARVWDIAPVSSKIPDWLLPLAEVISGYSLNQNSVLMPTKLDRSGTLNQIRQKLNQSPANDDWTVWGRWFLADRSKRTISPFSKMTIPDYIMGRIGEDTVDSLNEAESLVYNNTNLLQKISEAREALKTKSQKSDKYK